jgi:tripartite-type tricarboxylate transporter receptor subunit TctC
VARAPDGYAAAATAAHVTAVHLMKSLPYDPVKDFTPIAAAVEPATCLAVNAAVPVNSVEELIAYARSRPDELSYGSSGVGSVFHMMGELFNQTAGVRVKHVPYRGVVPAMQDVIAGHIPMVFISVSNALPAVQSGASRSGRARAHALRQASQVPSMSEIIPALKPSSWFGFFGPAGLPGEIDAAQCRDGQGARRTRWPASSRTTAMAVIGGTPEEFAALIADGIARYGAIIKAAGSAGVITPRAAASPSSAARCRRRDGSRSWRRARAVGARRGARRAGHGLEVELGHLPGSRRWRSSCRGRHWPCAVAVVLPGDAPRERAQRLGQEVRPVELGCTSCCSDRARPPCFSVRAKVSAISQASSHTPSALARLEVAEQVAAGAVAGRMRLHVGAVDHRRHWRAARAFSKIISPFW